MATVLFPYRVSQVWSYTVGMGRLLLRSPKSPGAATRVDVLFQNVKALKLPTRLEGLSVRSPGDEELQSIGDSPCGRSSARCAASLTGTRLHRQSRSLVIP